MYIKFYLKRMISHNYLKYISYYVLLIILYYIEIKNAEIYMITTNSHYTVGAFYAAINLFIGMEKYIPGIGIRFEVPYVWLINYIFLCFIVGDFSSARSGAFEHKAVMGALKRTKIAFATLIGGISNTIISLYIMIMATITYIFIYGWRRSDSIALISVRKGIDLSVLSDDKFLIQTIIMIFLGTYMLVNFQTILCIFVDAKVAFVTSIMILVIGAYYNSLLLPGNYCMILRNEILCYKGVSLIQSIMYGIFLTIILSAFTIIKTKRKDFY